MNADELNRLHIKRLEAHHAEEFEERFGPERTRAEKRRRALCDEVSRRFNHDQKARHEHETERAMRDAEASVPEETRVLPDYWQNWQWKKLVELAREKTGITAENKDQAEALLRAYVSGDPLPTFDVPQDGRAA